MKYIFSLILLFACSVSLYAMDDDSQDAQSAIIKSDLPYTAQCVAFSPTSNKFVAAHKESIRIYNSDAQTLGIRVFSSDVHDLFYSPSGDKIVIRLSDGATIMETEELTGSFRDQLPPAPRMFKFNSKGDSVRQIDDSTVRVDFALAQQVPSGVSIRDNLGEVISADINDNGHVAIASRNKVQLWDYKRGKIIKERVYEKNNINLVRLNPTGDRMAINSSSGNDQESAKTEVWDMQGDEPLYSTPDSFNGVRFVDDKLIVTSVVNDVAIMDAATGEVLNYIPGFYKQVRSCSFSPNNKYFAQSDKDTVNLYDTQGNLLSKIKHNGEVTFIQAVSPKGDSLAVTTGKGTSIWRLKHLLQQKAKL
jgi:WD40 repeat protein